MKTMKLTSPYARENTAHERCKALYLKLLALLKQRRRYRSDDCSLPKVATDLGVSPRVVSNVVKTCFKGNFNALINSLRLRDACKMLENPRYAHNTLEEIALLTGFQSRQAFYLAFHRLYDCTPADYRKEKREK